MSVESSSYLIVLVIAIISLGLWRFRRIKFNRLVIIPAILAILAFQTLFFLQGSMALPGKDDPFENQVVATIAIILAFKTVLQVFKFIFIYLMVTRYKIKVPRFLVDLLAWLAIIIVLLVIVREVFEVQLTGLLVTSTVATAIIGLSLQEILGNLFAGVILQIEAPFTIDDWVEVSGLEGKVIRQNWRTLTILTRMNHHVMFTNSNVANEKIVNYSRPSVVQRQNVFIGVAYRHPPGKVKEVLFKAISDVEGVLRKPKPRVYLIEYGDSSINYRVSYWIRDYARLLEIEDEVMSRFWYALHRAGMGIPFPIRDVNLRMVPQDEQEEREKRIQIRQLLRSLSFLEELNNAQIERLAIGAQWQKYTTGEALVRQGEKGDSLFIIKSGHTGIYINSKHGELRVNERTAGEFFGEMSLLTGEPRSASVIAEAETEVITIGKEDFVEILINDPTILELLLNALEKRRNNIESKQAAADARSREQGSKERSALMQKIVQFLGISMK